MDDFWYTIFDRPTKYTNLDILVKSLLCISHGNADVERGFSTSGLVLTDLKPQMKVRTLIDEIKSYQNKIHLFPINSDLIKLAHNAKKRYDLYLQNEIEK